MRIWNYCLYWDYFYFRIEGKGKGILQHHQVIAEFEAIPEESRKKLVGGAFADVLRSTQVTLITLAVLSFVVL